MTIRGLTEAIVDCSEGRGAALNVCIVTSEFLGPIKNGGLGTATTGLAKQLVADGHKVTLLYTNVENGTPVSMDKPWKHWVEKLSAEGIELEFIPLQGDYQARRHASWLVKEFIGRGDFNLVYFNEFIGSGYYSLLAKEAGLEPFCRQLHCVVTHGSIEWIFNINDQYARSVADVEWMGLEQRSVELADVVISPSAYLLREYERYGWQLPERTFHQPYPIYRKPGDGGRKQLCPVDELVFFGRLEVRKGLWLFCEALDRLSSKLAGVDVTFLGRGVQVGSSTSPQQIVTRAANWASRVRLLTDYDQDQAISYLCQPGKLAVMPSIADNSPCTVYECMEAGIPFITTRGSGADELVHPDCWDDVMVEAMVEPLVRKLAQVLDGGARLARPRFDPEDNLATWSRWHDSLSKEISTLVRQRTAPQQSSAESRSSLASTPALLVVIDNGACKLSSLVENLGSHMRRFGGRAAYLLLTSRQGELQELLLELFTESPEVPGNLCILDPRMIEGAQELICASQFVFFVDAEVEILTSFFVLALNKLGRGDPALVSCAVAVREGTRGPGELEHLPAADLPGMAALERWQGGSVWAATGLAEQLSSVDLYDGQRDLLTSAAAIGQLLTLRGREGGVPVHILPIVGALETRHGGTASQPEGVNDIRELATAFGVSPSLLQGGPAWFAISRFSGDQGRPARAPMRHPVLLPAEHPLSELDVRSNDEIEGVDLPELAAAFGRPYLSLQMEAANGPAPGRSRHLVDLATRAQRCRPTFDLLDGITPNGVHEYGATAAPVKQKRGEPAEDHLHSAIGDVHAFLDARRLEIDGNIVRALNSLRVGGPGRLLILDVPLLGHATLIGTVTSSAGSDPVFLCAKIIDQQLGQTMGSADVRLVPDGPESFSIPLCGVYGLAMVALEFSGAETMEVTIERLELH